MNRRSFTLGMGIGVIVMSVVFYAIYAFQTPVAPQAPALVMSDEEIMKRAEKLGMILYEKLPATGQSPVAVSDQDIIARAGNLGMVFPEGAGLGQPGEAPTEAPGQAPFGDMASIEIPAGATSADIAALLQENGILPDAHDFNRYVRDRSLTKKLRSGVFQIPRGGSYDEILAAITKPQ